MKGYFGIVGQQADVFDSENPGLLKLVNRQLIFT